MQTIRLLLSATLLVLLLAARLATGQSLEHVAVNAAASPDALVLVTIAP